VREPTAVGEPHAVKRPQSLQEIRRQAREDWLKLRQESAKASENEHLKDDRPKNDYLNDDQFSR